MRSGSPACRIVYTTTILQGDVARGCDRASARWSPWAIYLARGGQGNRMIGMELFEPEDLDLARARFEELCARLA